jgi:hypothetical protein
VKPNGLTRINGEKESGGAQALAHERGRWVGGSRVRGILSRAKREEGRPPAPAGLLVREGECIQMKIEL